MMYHKNRLIKAYERVGCQLRVSPVLFGADDFKSFHFIRYIFHLQANNRGVGVIGIIECGLFLEPTHNKQSFNETDKYR